MSRKRERTAEDIKRDLDLAKLADRGQQIVAGADEFVWRMPVPDKVWSSNDRLHFRVRSGRVKRWRSMARIQVGLLRSPVSVFPLEGKWDVEMTLPFTQNRTRDMSNYVGTVVKATVDGLVDAGVWPDDNGRHVRVLEPLPVKEKPQAWCWVRLARIEGS